MRAMDVMTSGVITVGENASMPEAAKLNGNARNQRSPSR
jgi:hypothetical protein